jgi:hypothetical protein
MRTARRFVYDESGMTMALVVIMIVLLGVMGAGLLTFVMRDLNTVVEENRGQRAFAVADAGIEAAKGQLASNVVRANYDGDGIDLPTDDGDCGSDDIQWSALGCDDPDGMTLNDLDGDAATSDSVNVTIEYRGSAKDDFRVVSTGTYGSDPIGVAKRRIEAIFKGVEAGAGSGETIGHPVYYTPSDIQIMQDSDNNNPVSLIQVSLFTRQNILIPDHPSYHVTTKDQLTTDIGDSKGSVTTQGNDALCDWNSKIPLKAGCFDNGTQGGWNTVSRTIQTPGMAAEGKICSYDSTISTSTCSSTSASLADGVYSFDSSTNPRFVAKDCQINNLATCPDNAAGTISPPFPLPKPIPSGLKAAACAPPGTAAACQKTPPPVSYFVGNPNTTDTNWGLGTNDASNSRVAFIDAQNKTLTYAPPGGKHKGIIVVWCGRLEMNEDFEGIILNIVGDLPGNTSCTKDTATTNPTTGLPDGKTVGTYVNQGRLCQCWVYAEGGTTTLAGTHIPGIQLNPNSRVQFRPSSDWSFQDGLFVGPPPTDFKLQSWRELYQ